MPRDIGLYAAVALLALGVVGRMGTAGRVMRAMALWGACSAALFVLLNAVGAPLALRVPANPYTVGLGAVLGLPGIGLALLAHALYR